MKSKHVIVTIFLMCCMLGCSADQMEVISKDNGKLVFSRSKPLPDVSHVGFYLGSECIWRVLYGSRDFTEIEFGVLPDFSDHRTNPKQTIPDGENVRELHEGQKVIIILEFRKDYFPLKPSSSSECWEVIIPKIGEKSKAKKIKCQ